MRWRLDLRAIRVRICANQQGEQLAMAEFLNAREMMERLVAFPTVSRDSNLELVAFVRDYLAGHGIESRVVHSADGAKANILSLIHI